MGGDSRQGPSDGLESTDRRKGGSGHRGGRKTRTRASQSGSRFTIRNVASILKGRGKRRVASVKQEEFNTNVPSNGLPVCEDVDEDGTGPEATMEDDLILLASFDEMWREELVKFREAKRRDQEEMQKERMVMLEKWRQTVEPT